MDIDIIPFKGDLYPWELLLSADPEKSLVEKYLNLGETFVARLNENTIGVIVLLEKHPGIMEIMNVAVSEPFQNRGIGRRLVTFGIKRAGEKGMTKVEIGTGNPGVGQMLLYQKCGFRIIGVDLDFFRRNYPEKIYENGIECRDMIRMEIIL